MLPPITRLLLVACCLLLTTTASESAPPAIKTTYCGVPPGTGVPRWSVPPLNNPGYSLRLVLVVNRHGDRTVASTTSACWPGDTAVWNCSLTVAAQPETKPGGFTPGSRLFQTDFLQGRNFFAGNCMTGQLTDLGYGQAQTVGDILRQAYVGRLLPAQLDPARFFFRADYFSRTLQTARGIIHGLYPPAHDQPTQVLSLHTMDLYLDDMVANSALCPRLGSYYAEAAASPGYLAYVSKVAVPVLARAQKAFGWANLTLENLLGQVSDCMYAHVCHGFEVPAGVDQQLFDDVQGANSWLYNYSNTFPSPELGSQVGIGFLIAELVDAINAFQANGSAGQPLFRLYSGHDITLFNLLAAFKVWDGVWPPYTSALIWEVYESKSGEWAVRLIYNGKVLPVGGCPAGLCDWKTFSAIVAELVPQDPAKNCQPTSTSA